jgi:uncharacterized protein YjbI with pentapeptide repeats
LFGVVLVDGHLEGADLSSARLIADLNRANLEGAKLIRGRYGADMTNQPMGKLRTLMVNANLKKSDLTGSDLSGCDLKFSDLTGANLTDANLTDCDLRNADFTDANMTHTKLNKAMVAGAKFHGIQGKETLIGLESASGVKEALFE